MSTRGRKKNEWAPRQLQASLTLFFFLRASRPPCRPPAARALTPRAPCPCTGGSVLAPPARAPAPRATRAASLSLPVRTPAPHRAPLPPKRLSTMADGKYFATTKKGACGGAGVEWELGVRGPTRARGRARGGPGVQGDRAARPSALFDPFALSPPSPHPSSRRDPRVPGRPALPGQGPQEGGRQESDRRDDGRQGERQKKGRVFFFHWANMGWGTGACRPSPARAWRLGRRGQRRRASPQRG